MTHTPFEHILAEYSRYFAQTLHRGFFGEMHSPVNDDGSPAGYAALVDKMANEFQKRGGRIFYNTKVVAVRGEDKGDDDDGGEEPDIFVHLANGGLVKTQRVVLNLAAAQLRALGDSSLPLSEMAPAAKQALDKAYPARLTKAYMFFKDAFWRWPSLNQGDLRLYSGRGRTDMRNTQVRYHDGAVTCGDSFFKPIADEDATGECQGALLVSYSLAGAGNAGDGSTWSSQFADASGMFSDGQVSFCWFVIVMRCSLAKKAVTTV